jgi:hypothetical protein
VSDYPSGNGNPDCPTCFGRGVVTVEEDGLPGGATRDCSCVYVQDIKANLERIWKGLTTAEIIENSVLKGRTEENLRITATVPDLKRHLRHVGVRMGTRWSARVVSDADLMSAWLATVAEALDPDVTTARIRSKGEFFTLSDIALAHDLLIVQTGVKAAKNREMPAVLLEAIQERAMEGKPTWLVDSPAKPLRDGHVSYSDSLWEVVSEWEWEILSDAQSQAMPAGVRGPTSAPIRVPPTPPPKARKQAPYRPPAARVMPEEPEPVEPEDEDDVDISFMGNLPMGKEERLESVEQAKKDRIRAREAAKRGKNS